MQMQFDLAALKMEMQAPAVGRYAAQVYRAEGYSAHAEDENVIARAYAIRSLFVSHRKHLYDNDRFAGSQRGMYAEVSAEAAEAARAICAPYPERGFHTNSDHYGANYSHFLTRGIGGTLEDIDASLVRYADDAEKTSFLRAARIAMEGFAEMILGYAGEAEKKALALVELIKTGDEEAFHKLAGQYRLLVESTANRFAPSLGLLYGSLFASGTYHCGGVSSDVGVER